jgi:NTP pyrophosphatase (non-canonical NTP hydrolase)
MKRSPLPAGRMQLDDYALAVPRIYGAHDQYRSISDVWCHALHHGAAIAERVRKKAPLDELFTEIADFALWLFTTVCKLSGRLGDRKASAGAPAEALIRVRSSCSNIVWHRYPKICHVCYARRSKNSGVSRSAAGMLEPCDCPAQGADRRNKDTKRSDSLNLYRFAEDNQAQKPGSIDDWQLMFASIFRANIEGVSSQEIALHLMEELGEVSDAMVRMYSYTKKDFRRGEPNWRQLRLESQLADVFSWLFALILKINAGNEFSSVVPITLAEIIWRRYGSNRLRSFRCPCCDKKVCSCPLIFVPATRSTKEWLANFSPAQPAEKQRKKKRGLK